MLIFMVWMKKQVMFQKTKKPCLELAQEILGVISFYDLKRLSQM